MNKEQEKKVAEFTKSIIDDEIDMNCCKTQYIIPLYYNDINRNAKSVCLSSITFLKGVAKYLSKEYAPSPLVLYNFVGRPTLIIIFN